MSSSKTKGWRQAPANAAKEQSEAQRSPLLRAVRSMRMFSPRLFLHKNVGGIYCGIVVVAFVAANIGQHRRMNKLYPDYDVVAKKTGAQYGSMKEQELADVHSFLRKAEGMRSDLRTRL